MNPENARAGACRIRDASSADLSTLVHFNLAMARETEARELAQNTVNDGVRRLLEDPSRGRYLVATVDDNIVGQLMLTREWSDWRNGDFWWIQSVYVAPAFRRRGVFSTLFEHVRDQARDDSGVCGLRLYVDHANTRAQEAYRNLGAATTDYVLMEWDFTS